MSFQMSHFPTHVYDETSLRNTINITVTALLTQLNGVSFGKKQIHLQTAMLLIK